MQKATKFFFCLTIATLVLFQNTAWCQTKNDVKGGAWRRGVHQVARKVVTKYGRSIALAAKRHGIPKQWLGGIMLVESSGDQHAAGGLMQAGEIAKRDTGIKCNVKKPKCSIEVSAAYLAKLKHHYKLNLPRMVLAYNQGPTSAQLINHPFQQTYLKRFLFAVVAYNTAVRIDEENT